MMKESEDEYDSYGTMISQKLRKLADTDKRVYLKLQGDINNLLLEAELSLL